MSEAICPNGHLSDTADYCDQCGAKIGGEASPAAAPDPGAAAPAPAPAPGVPAAPDPAAPVHVPCPACGAPNAEGDRYCEACGYDVTLGPPVVAAAPGAAPEAPAAPAGPPPPASWTLTASADQAYYERLQADDIPFPAVYPERTFTLVGGRNVIGRRSTSRGINPEIDLSGAPEDPGVSHLHAVLVGTPDGGWSIIDPGSANGTFLNDSTDPLKTNTGVPLAAGDRIHVGAWTTLTIERA